MKYFIVCKSIYAVNIWRQSLIKLWRTPSAGAAAVSSIHNLVRENLAELCGKQVALKEDGTNVPMLCRSQLGSSEMDIVSGGCWAFPKWYPVPTGKSLSHHLQQVRMPLRGTGYLTRALALPQGMQVLCILLCAPLSYAPHQGAGRCWPLAQPFFVSHAPTEEFI